ncbi:hypothetical protein ETAA8_24890 [Anatilimnocola aggregata]|uniref:Sialate O-acetylesterase domain-containing protein n=1 Tax=Anatilimnocola aggregata TaxID=2528021 RepID=A0A517YBA4_9BACT|nr:sialate O-acetylesterase [Anatilimnocola aggregata]QDU27402.1 hypothetical protein ETAA8_24890 [Anatilimnocola aggregata]
MSHRRKFPIAILTLITALASGLWSPASAQVKVAPIFGNGMVLQREIAVPVWGTASPGEEVTVTLGEQKQTAKADEMGKWQVELNKLTAGGPHELTVAGKNMLKFTDVLVGEVWLCSGQSNMAWRLAQCNADAEISAANDDQLRHNGGGSNWQKTTPQTAGNFSGVGYYFGKELRKALGVPVGLINRSVGGTSARLWTSRAVIESADELKPFLASLLKPDVDKQGKEKPLNLGVLYEGHIRPVVPYGIRGAIWYQGESDAGRPAEYAQLFPTMIKSWRKDFNQGDFPFLFVQLAPIGGAQKQPAEGGWGPIREAQNAALALPNTAVAVIVDSDVDLHPKKKEIPGARLAQAARAIAYGEKVTPSGPLYDSVKFEAGKAIVSFKHVDKGLETRGEKLTGFAIAGDDGKFVWADAKVEGDKVVVSSPDVPKPVAVRYGWASNPACNLFSASGMPASPFRTDPTGK